MISFPTCKINLGLNILSKRKDGYHEVNSLMYPVPVKDVLEIVPAESFEFTCSGLPIPGAVEQNLIFKAYELMKTEFNLPPVKIHLYKNIPMGGGLGGGSSNGAYTLKLLNTLFNLKISAAGLQERAAQLGSDCPFFIEEIPQIAKGRGEKLTPYPMDLKGKYLLLVNDGTHISTADAYGRIQPKTPTHLLENVLSSPIKSWKVDLINDFEAPTLEAYPQLATIREQMYELGAYFAGMTGSGSTMFGLFDAAPKFETSFHFSKGFVRCVEL
jgi:4-diphosphocytidyl-2-C-methyl-D-erythritol kinase